MVHPTTIKKYDNSDYITDNKSQNRTITYDNYWHINRKDINDESKLNNNDDCNPSSLPEIFCARIRE